MGVKKQPDSSLFLVTTHALKSGAEAPHSKTLARLRKPLPNFREVLERGASAPLFTGHFANGT
jgi:hypothetical protein